MLFSVKADAFGSAAKQFKQHGGSFPVTIKTKPQGVQCEGVEGATAKPPRRSRRSEILCVTKKYSWF